MSGRRMANGAVGTRPLLAEQLPLYVPPEDRDKLFKELAQQNKWGELQALAKRLDSGGDKGDVDVPGRKRRGCAGPHWRCVQDENSR